jgi:signal transduction histidine kinase
MRERFASLRSRIARVTAVVTVLALVVAGALEVLTKLLHHTNTYIGESVRSIRMGDNAQIDLLLHARVHDPVVARAYEQDLRLRLMRLGDFVSSSQETSVLAAAQARTEEYLAAVHAHAPAGQLTELHAEAFSALEDLVAINMAQAADAQAESTRWDDIASVVTYSTVGLLLLVVGGLLYWLRARAFQPLYALASVMDRFGKGDLDAQAVEGGSQELREMARRFNEMAEALAAQRRAQMAFLAGIAHDLRNPLSVIKTAASLVAPDRPLPREDRLRQTMELVNRQIGRLDRMIADLLDTARIEAGRLELKVQPCDLREVVTSVADLFVSAAPGREIVVTVPDLAVSVACDSQRLEQVLTNLISNALKYSSEGSVVRVELGMHDQEAVLTVRDQGLGLSDEERSHLFEPFRRVGPSKESVPGAGLGLFTVRRIVEAHGGHIEVESATGQGSAFRVRLPVEAVEQQQAAPR